MKRIGTMLFVLALSLGLYIFPGKAGELSPPNRPTGPVAVSCGDGMVAVDDYGNATAFQIGNDNHLAPVDGTIQWVSINGGPVGRVNAMNYMVAAAVETDDSGCPPEATAQSTVIRNASDLQIDFSHRLADSGEGLVSWFVTATLTNLTDQEMSVCYYHYANLDLFGTPDNDSATYTGSDPDTGLPAYRPVIDADHPDQIFAYRTYVPRDAWAQLLNPELSNLIDGFEDCGTLPRMERLLDGDITGAFQYNRTIAPGKSTSVQLEIGRIQ